MSLLRAATLAHAGIVSGSVVPTPPAGTIIDGRDVATFTGSGVSITVNPTVGIVAAGAPAPYTRDGSGTAVLNSTDFQVTNIGNGTIAAGTYFRRIFTGGTMFIPSRNRTFTQCLFIGSTGAQNDNGIIQFVDAETTGTVTTLTSCEVTSTTIANFTTTSPSSDRAINMSANYGWTMDRCWVHGTVRGIYFHNHGINPPTWASGTPYVINEMVTYNNGTARTDTNRQPAFYICVQANTGQTPDNVTAFWRRATADDFLLYRPEYMRVIKNSMFGNFHAGSSTGDHTSSIGHGTNAKSAFVAIQNVCLLNISSGAPSGCFQIYPEDFNDGASYWLIEGVYIAGTNGGSGLQTAYTVGTEMCHHDLLVRNNFFGNIGGGGTTAWVDGGTGNTGFGAFGGVGVPAGESRVAAGADATTLHNYAFNNRLFTNGVLGGLAHTNVNNGVAF